MNTSPNLQNDLIPYVGSNSPYSPPEAFARFVQSKLNPKLSPVVQIKLIQNLAKKYNDAVSDERNIDIYFYTVYSKEKDKSASKIYGQYKLERIYLTTDLTTDIFPNYSDEIQLLEEYLTGDVQIDSLNSRFTKQKLEAKYKWKYKVENFVDDMFGVNNKKVVSVVVLITKKQELLSYDERVVLKDEKGRYYTEHPITLVGDPNFYIFGPYDL